MIGNDWLSAPKLEQLRKKSKEGELISIPDKGWKCLKLHPLSEAKFVSFEIRGSIYREHLLHSNPYHCTPPAP